MSRGERALQSAVRIMVEENMNELPSDEELRKEIHVSSEFEKNMERILLRVRIKQGILGAVKAAAAIFLAVVVGFSVLCLVNEDVRAYTQNFIRVHLAGGMTAYSVLEDTSKVEKELAGIDFTYIPEGYDLVKELEEPFNPEVGMAVYEKDSGKTSWSMINFIYQKNATGENNAIDNEHSTLKRVVLRDGTGCDFYKCNTKGYASYLVWIKDEILCTLAITDNLEGWETKELMKIANGMKMVYKDKTEK